MDALKKRLAALLSVKSIVTIVLTAVFSYLAIVRVISGDQFLTIFTIVIGFYFGSQSEKGNSTQATKGGGGNE